MTGLGVGLLLALYLLQTGVGIFGAVGDVLFGDILYNGMLALACGLCLLRARVVPQDRAAWAVLGASIGLWTAGELYWTLALSSQAEPPFPSLADGLWIASYPVAYVGLVLLIRSRLHDSFRASLWLDGALAASASAAITAGLILQPILDTTGGSIAAVATNLAYPLGDFVLLALVAGMLALTGWRPGRAWALLGAGLLVRGVADCVFLYQAAKGTYVEHTLLDPLWPASALLIAAAAWRLTPTPTVLLEGWRVFILPSAFTLSALGLLVWDHFDRTPHLAIGFATLAVALAIGRMALMFRENMEMLERSRVEAATDPLTGLGNRRLLMADLEAALSDASAEDPRMVVLFDLDGFKGYNDTYGHPAGDALLARLGAKLRAAVEPYGRAYRIGGDEFCALVPTLGSAPAAFLAAARHALSEEGEGFSVHASSGAATIPLEALTAVEALQIADRRMYAQKDRRSRSAGRQASDALLRMLHEREPALRAHLRDVSELSVPVGRRLGMTGEALDELRRAAELHDLGKIALPEAILEKPGPLEESESAFMRAHTMIGERILSAAPALAPVGRLVRSSHERWDGEGYPDGLRGEKIPLGARVIAVCDAFAAMTSARPDRSTLTSEEALEELERCAGSQFDPRVVAAFCAEMAYPSARSLADEPLLEPTLG